MKFLVPILYLGVAGLFGVGLLATSDPSLEWDHLPGGRKWTQIAYLVGAVVLAILGTRLLIKRMR